MEHVDIQWRSSAVATPGTQDVMDDWTFFSYEKEYFPDAVPWTMDEITQLEATLRFQATIESTQSGHLLRPWYFSKMHFGLITTIYTGEIMAGGMFHAFSVEDLCVKITNYYTKINQWRIDMREMGIHV